MSKVLKLSEYLDALSASGIRGMRLSKEAGVQRITLNDISPQAYDLILKNVARNNLEVEVTCENANVLMHEHHFRVVDLDPFGSPSPYLAAASRCVTSHLFITATDTAPLCGAHMKSGMRKYMSMPIRTSYHREMGARILLGFAARELARFDKGVLPLLTHVTDHYVRTYLKVIKGAKAADKALEHMGYIEHCFICGSFVILKNPNPKGICNHCHSKTALAGPLWLGKIHDSDILKEALNMLLENTRARRILEMCMVEVDAPMYYDHHNICERLNITPGKISDVVRNLHEQGFKASRTHFSGVGIKTDAPMVHIEEAIKGC